MFSIRGIFPLPIRKENTWSFPWRTGFYLHKIWRIGVKNTRGSVMIFHEIILWFFNLLFDLFLFTLNIESSLKINNHGVIITKFMKTFIITFDENFIIFSVIILKEKYLTVCLVLSKNRQSSLILSMFIKL